MEINMSLRSRARRIGFPLTTGVAAVVTLVLAGSASTTPAVTASTPDRPVTASTPDRGGELPIIRGKVGPGFTITVSRQHAPPGRYRLIVRDLSSMHNWHVRGPGVDRSTGVPFTGRREWTVRLQVGTYRIVCDPHSSSMRTQLHVTN
jgi:hypothetical protein